MNIYYIVFKKDELNNVTECVGMYEHEVTLKQEIKLLYGTPNKQTKEYGYSLMHYSTFKIIYKKVYEKC